MAKRDVYKRGEIYLAEMNPNGLHIPPVHSNAVPILVLQSDDGSIHCPSLTVVLLDKQYGQKTGQKLKRQLQTDEAVEVICSLEKTGFSIMKRITRIDKRQIRGLVGRVEDVFMENWLADLEDNYGIIIPETVEAP